MVSRDYYFFALCDFFLNHDSLRDKKIKEVKERVLFIIFCQWILMQLFKCLGFSYGDLDGLFLTASHYCEVDGLSGLGVLFEVG